MENIRFIQSLTTYTVREKRVILKLHDRWNTHSRQCLRMKNGEFYEGHFQTFRPDRVDFWPAQGPWSSPENFYNTIEILIEDIELIIFHSHDGRQSGPVWDFLMRTSQPDNPDQG